MGILDRVKNAWNAFNYNENFKINNVASNLGSGSSQPVYTSRYSKGSIIDTIITRIAMDVSMVEFRHVIVDKSGIMKSEVKSGLNNVLSLEANIDETYIEFIQDIVFSMFDEGVVCVVPTHTNRDPNLHDSYKIYEMRTGKIEHWYPSYVSVKLYNEKKGDYQTVNVKKRNCAIIQNPLYYIINDNNSTLKRLSRKLALLDKYDEELASNAFNMILQFPYEVRSEQQIKMANDRIKQIEAQLAKKANKHGIAWIGGNEKITQVGSNKENNLVTEIKELTQDLFNQLGLTANIFNGTASEQELKYYNDRTIYPICKRIAAEFTRKFLTETARTQGHRINYSTDLFTLVPLEQLANTLDILRRNSMITANEGRRVLKLEPSSDPSADALFNPNVTPDPTAMGGEDPNAAGQSLDFSSIMEQLDENNYNDVLEYANKALGSPEDINDAISNADEETINDITAYAQQLLDSQNQNGEAEQEEM